MVKHNNSIPNVHLRKHWQNRIRLHFDQPAKKQARHQRRAAKAARLFPRPTEKLRPVVSSCTRKYAGKVRYGRGFTLDEIKAAGLNAAFARTVGIAVDHRRTNTSESQLQANVERLNTYKSKLILFPRRENKPKKGLINDATAEQLKSAAAQNQVTGHILPISKPTLADEFAPITEEDKKRNVYRTTRTLRTNKRYLGRREKRAKEAAEETK